MKSGISFEKVAAKKKVLKKTSSDTALTHWDMWRKNEDGEEHCPQSAADARTDVLISCELWAANSSSSRMKFSLSC